MPNHLKSGINVYNILDEWWGEHFGPSVADRLDLPYEHALSLYNHCAQYKLPTLPGSEPSAVQLRPVLSPWITESEDTILAAAQARVILDMLSGKSDASMYGFVRYAGAWKSVHGEDFVQPVGTYKLWQRMEPWTLMQKRLREICALALYSHQILLNIESIIPQPPPEGCNDGAYAAWLSDVRHRLSLLVAIRPLYASGVIELGTSGPPHPPLKLTEQPGKSLMIEDSEENQLLESIDFIIEGDAPSNDTFRSFISRALLMPQLLNTLSGATVAEAQLYYGKPVLERVTGKLLSQATGRPADAFMDKWMQIALPVPGGSDIGAMMWATSMLRRDSELYEEWRIALTEAIQYATALVGTETASSDFHHIFESKLGPKVKNLRAEISRTKQFQSGLKTATVHLGVGGLGITGVHIAGGNLVDAAATVAATTLGTATLEFIQALRAPKNPNAAMEAYVSLGFK